MATINETLFDTLASASELANNLSSLVLSARTEQNAKLELVEFAELFTETWNFFVRCEVICRRMIVSLRGVISSQAGVVFVLDRATSHQASTTGESVPPGLPPNANISVRQACRRRTVVACRGTASCATSHKPHHRRCRWRPIRVCPRPSFHRRPSHQPLRTIIISKHTYLPSSAAFCLSCTLITESTPGLASCARKRQRHGVLKASAHRGARLLPRVGDARGAPVACRLPQGHRQHPNVNNGHDEPRHRVSQVVQLAHVSGRARRRRHAQRWPQEHHRQAPR
jgi:hypothetical protein